MSSTAETSAASEANNSPSDSAQEKRVTRLKRANSERTANNVPPPIPQRRPPPPPPPPSLQPPQQASPTVPPPVSPRRHTRATAVEPSPEERQRIVAAKRGNLKHSNTFTAKDAPGSAIASAAVKAAAAAPKPLTKQEIKRRDAVWDLFQSEIAFLVDHLMVLKHVRFAFDFLVRSFLSSTGKNPASAKRKSDQESVLNAFSSRLNAGLYGAVEESPGRRFPDVCRAGTSLRKSR